MKKFLVAALSILVVCGAAVAMAKDQGSDENYYVKLYEDDGFQGRTVTLKFKENAPDLHIQGFNDKTSSVEYNIPHGWNVILHADTGYQGSTYDIMDQGGV